MSYVINALDRVHNIRILACDSKDAIDLLTNLIDSGEKAYIIGQVTKAPGVLIK